ncbi:hypothetical protein [Candidatus Methylomirabilis sp.]|uniref:hypothetical protein n=1 Tax=Candidatus Methylomirabilis sp. TaxID=2032687 RepID=UPI003C73617D
MGGWGTTINIERAKRSTFITITSWKTLARSTVQSMEGALVDPWCAAIPQGVMHKPTARIAIRTNFVMVS